jgi:hypothetical protein
MQRLNQHKTGQEAKSHYRDDEGSGAAGVDMVAHMQHSCTTRQRYRGSVSKCDNLHNHKLVLMQHDMQRSWLLVRPAFLYVRTPHRGNGSDDQDEALCPSSSRNALSWTIDKC